MIASPTLPNSYMFNIHIAICHFYKKLFLFFFVQHEEGLYLNWCNEDHISDFSGWDKVREANRYYLLCDNTTSCLSLSLSNSLVKDIFYSFIYTCELSDFILSLKQKKPFIFCKI